MKNKISDGKTQNFTAGAAYVAGDVFVFKTSATVGHIGVVVTDVANGAEGVAEIEGVFELPAKAADTPAIGDLLYWDATNKELTTTSTNNTLAGKAWTAKAADVTKIKIKLNGGGAN